MKKLNKIVILPEESAALKVAQTVAETIALRFQDANGGRWDGRLDMEMAVKFACDDTPHCWWTVHPYLESMQSGHNHSLELALEEMHGRTDPNLKRQQAKRLKTEAKRLEQEAQKLEAA